MSVFIIDWYLFIHKIRVVLPSTQHPLSSVQVNIRVGRKSSYIAD